MLTVNEREWLNHMTRWGSDGYPIEKVKRGWIWRDAFGCKGAPKVFRTRKEAHAAVERYEDILIDKAAGREDAR
jgi:hypothetical protein